MNTEDRRFELLSSLVSKAVIGEIIFGWTENGFIRNIATAKTTWKVGGGMKGFALICVSAEELENDKEFTILVVRSKVPGIIRNVLNRMHLKGPKGPLPS